MNEQTWTFVDKATWGDGPWQREPDKVQWTDEVTGLPCLAVRNPHSGNWCGYVGVAEGHPLFGVDYGACPQQCEETYCEHSPSNLLSAHGGITYSDYCQETEQPFGICHIPEPGQPDHVYWFGFDCAHLGDKSPAYAALYGGSFSRPNERYRDLPYVQSECRQLAAQLRALV